MEVKDALWDVFKRTGYIGAYLIYKDYERGDASQNNEQSRNFKKAVGSGDSSNI